MSKVSWIKLSDNFFTNQKTMKMRRALGTVEPILRLWLWAANNAQDGLLKVDPLDIEEAIGWRGEPGKAVQTMVECGFLEPACNVLQGVTCNLLRIHDWMEHNGDAVSTVKNTREATRMRVAAHRERLKKIKELGELEKDCNAVAPLLRNADVTPLDKIRSEEIRRREEEEGGNVTVTALHDPKQTLRISNARDLIHALRCALERVRPGLGMYSPGRFAPNEASRFLEGLGDDLGPAQELLLERIETFAQSETCSPWTVARFVEKFNTLTKPSKVSEDWQP
jgi:hypothetical protein